MAGRHRTRPSQTFTTDKKQVVTYIEVCDDVTEAHPFTGNHQLDITKQWQEDAYIKLPSRSGTIPLFGLVGTKTLNDFAPDNSYVNRVLSQTGPLTPRLYLPVSLFELRDIPRMLQHAGDLLHKISRPRKLDLAAEAASANLAYQFGWKPLIEDIGKMIDFSDVVKKRQRMLKAAHSTNGVKRKVFLDEDSSKGPSGSSLVNALMPNSKRTSQKTNKKWGTVRWTVRDQTQIGKEPSFGDAFRTAYGLNKGHIPINVWKAMPWTWAIDWFADISNVLQANYNMIYYKPSSVCIMTSLQTVYTYEQVGKPTDPSYFRGGKMFYTRKLRTVHSPNASISLRLPFMDSFKLSILGSMTVLKLKRAV